jgi:hypothetical protein
MKLKADVGSLHQLSGGLADSGLKCEGRGSDPPVLAINDYYVAVTHPN